MRMLLGSGAAKMGVSQNEVTDFLFFIFKKTKKQVTLQVTIQQGQTHLLKRV